MYGAIPVVSQSISKLVVAAMVVEVMVISKGLNTPLHGYGTFQNFQVFRCSEHLAGDASDGPVGVLEGDGELTSVELLHTI